MKQFLKNYIVTRDGEVIQWRTLRTLKAQFIKGYKRVSLYHNKKNNTFLVHRLVAYTYCPGYIQGLEVNHKDGNKTNNHADNLEWIDRKGNMLHAIETGLTAKKLTTKDMQHIRTYFARGMSQGNIAKMYNVNQSTISRNLHERKRNEQRSKKESNK